MASDRDGGQVFLLAGVLLAIAFVVLSTQLSLFASLGQQAGREVRNTLLEDYLLVRRTLETQIKEELRAENGTLMCPDLTDFGGRVATVMSVLSTLEQNRGQSLSWRNLTFEEAGAGTIRVNATASLSDPTNSVADQITYTVACTGTITAPPPPGGGCGSLPGVCPPPMADPFI